MAVKVHVEFAASSARWWQGGGRSQVELASWSEDFPPCPRQQSAQGLVQIRFLERAFQATVPDAGFLGLPGVTSLEQFRAQFRGKQVRRQTQHRVSYKFQQEVPWQLRVSFFGAKVPELLRQVQFRVCSSSSQVAKLFGPPGVTSLGTLQASSGGRAGLWSHSSGSQFLLLCGKSFGLLGVTSLVSVATQ